MNVFITVGICVKNCERTINDTIHSIVNQSYPHQLMEIIVVDDGCTDNTIAIITEKFREANMIFKVLRSGGAGLGKARQMVTDIARGKYIIWIDGDMTIPPDFITRQVSYMESHPKIGKARANWGLNKETKKLIVDYQLFAYAYQIKDKSQPKISGIGGSICRVEAIKEAGGFDISISGAGEDVDLAIRMLKCGWQVGVTDTFFYHSPKPSWNELLNQHKWYGYGAHYIRHKHRIKSLKILNFPLIAFLVSLRKARVAFELTGSIRSFLLPFPYFLNSIAWWIGYIKAHLEHYCPNT